MSGFPRPSDLSRGNYEMTHRLQEIVLQNQNNISPFLFYFYNMADLKKQEAPTTTCLPPHTITHTQMYLTHRSRLHLASLHVMVQLEKDCWQAVPHWTFLFTTDPQIVAITTSTWDAVVVLVWK